VAGQLANTAAAPLFFANTRTNLVPNGTFSVAAADQWSQNWTLTPLEDPDQLRRLRALYRFGAGVIGRHGLACEYPLVQKAPGGGGASGSTQTVNVFIAGNKASSERSGPPGNGNANVNYELIECPKKKYQVQTADPAFLKPPGCVICDYGDHKLVVNRLLSNEWLWNLALPLPPDALVLGHYSQQDLYLVPSESAACSQEGLGPVECSERAYSDFVLFVLEATLLASSTAGGGKGTPQKPGTAVPLQAPAAPQFQIIQ